MPPLRIDNQDDLARLRAYQADRDRLAQVIGAATVEWRDRLAQAERAIRQSHREEQTLGDGLLRTAGLDPDAGEYRIDPTTGVVTLWADGGWQEVER